MAARVHFNPDDPKRLPSRLRNYGRLEGLSVEGEDNGELEAAKVVAIVGTRDADEEVLRGTRWLAEQCAREGIVVVSGGATGVDSAAHEGAMRGGGVTWVVLPHGADHPLARRRAELFLRVVANRGRLVWPFRRDQAPSTLGGVTYHARNRVIAALADAVIATEAPHQSGTRNTLDWARQSEKPVWAVPPAPWYEHRGEGLRVEIEKLGARPLYAFEDLLASVVGARTTIPLFENKVRPAREDPEENQLVSALEDGPLHTDGLVAQTGLSAAAVTRALLTLTLDTVVVVAPDGRYRLCR